MREITATELSRNLRQILDSVEFMGEELLVVRNNHHIARIIPGSVHLTAMEAMTDIYGTLPEDAATGWLEDSRFPQLRQSSSMDSSDVSRENTGPS